MKIFDIIVVIILIALLIFGVQMMRKSMNSPSTGYGVFSGNTKNSQVLESVSGKSMQFYNNMRYVDRTIGYTIDPYCSQKKADDVKGAFLILEEKTLLRFYPSAKGTNSEIVVICSELPPSLEESQKGHFVAGEGGPTEIINATKFAVILAGKISLFKDEKCGSPKIALHEILHVLGFDHNSNSNSILYPVISCNEELDSYIAEEINRLYTTDSEPDLAIESIRANRTGDYLNFVATIVNYGLKKSENAVLEVRSGSDKPSNFNLNEMDLGTRKELTVENVLLKGNSGTITFEIALGAEGSDIDLSNNRADITLKS